MGCYVSKVGNYFHGILLTVTISMIADDSSQPQASKNNDFYNSQENEEIQADLYGSYISFGQI